CLSSTAHRRTVGGGVYVDTPATGRRGGHCAGFSSYSPSPESCDGTDSNFNGIIDAGCAPQGDPWGGGGGGGGGSPSPLPGITDGNCDSSREDEGCCSTMEGGPVHARTGDLVIGPVTDFVIRGAFGDDIEYSRLYYSGYPSRVGNASAAQPRLTV